jgi:hypothetical protein
MNMQSITHTTGRVKMDGLQVMRHLWRGGAYACLWNDRRQSYWFKPERLPAIPSAWKGTNIYVGVHPLSSIPPTNAQGQKAPPDEVRSQLKYVSAINCLFGEFDAKDEGVGDLQDVKDKALGRVNKVSIAPTLIIDSGGGYHCYWYLADTIHITDENRKQIGDLQAKWVDFIGSDKASKDLTRVLRVLGTTNWKNHFRPNYPIVTIEQYTPGLLYRLDDFESLLPAPAPKPVEPTTQARAATSARSNAMDSVIAEFNAQHPVHELLMGYGYPFCFRQGSTVRLARPGRTSREPSVTVDTIKNTSIHYSSSDPLYSDPSSLDPFEIETRLKHSGNHQRAYEAIKKELGRWVPQQPRQFRDPQTGRIENVT